MSRLHLNSEELGKWRAAGGDYTHIIDYKLNSNSSVIDLGGYTGKWADQIIQKYGCNIHLVEPLTEAFITLLNKFKDNPKVHILKVAVGTENTVKQMYINEDSTSFNIKSGEGVTVEIRTLERIMNQWNLQEVDLLQMNIEGDEYALLEHMIKTRIVDRFKNLQVQFHLGIENAEERHDDICRKLKAKGFRVKYSYPFVWEAWTKE